MIQRYKKKPVVIEAIQMTRGVEAKGWLGQALVQDMVWVHWPVPNTFEFKVRTLEGVMTGYEGDYLIRGVKEEMYPCRQDIFEETYELVDDMVQPEVSQESQAGREDTQQDNPANWFLSKEARVE